MAVRILLCALLTVCASACENSAGHSCSECSKACAPGRVQECSYAKCVCYYPQPARPVDTIRTRSSSQPASSPTSVNWDDLHRRLARLVQNYRQCKADLKAYDKCIAELGRDCPPGFLDELDGGASP